MVQRPPLSKYQSTEWASLSRRQGTGTVVCLTGRGTESHLTLTWEWGSTEFAKHRGSNKQDASVLRIAFPGGQKQGQERELLERPGEARIRAHFTVDSQAPPNDSEFLGWGPGNLPPGDLGARRPVWEPATGNKESVTF